MGKRGPQPTPAALRLLRGNPGHRPIKQGVKMAPTAVSEPVWDDLPPGDEFQQDAVRVDAQTEWRRVVPQLTAHGVLAAVDLRLVMDYCIVVARVAECERG